MRRIVLAALASASLVACSPLVLVNAVGPADARRRQGVPYGPLARQRLDVYAPEAPGTRPVVVFFYGGSWRSGHRGEYAFVGNALASRDVVAVIPDYRLYPEVTFPGFVEDAALAVAWVHEHAGDLGADPTRLFLAGHSAGGHLAVLVALDPRYLAAHRLDTAVLKGVVGLAGPYDFLPFTSHGTREAMGPEEGWPRTQPVAFARGGAPALLLLHGKDDETVEPRDSVILAERTLAAGGCARAVLYPGVGHVGVLLGLSPALDAWTPPALDELVRFTAAPPCTPGR